MRQNPYKKPKSDFSEMPKDDVRFKSSVKFLFGLGVISLTTSLCYSIYINFIFEYPTYFMSGPDRLANEKSWFGVTLILGVVAMILAYIAHKLKTEDGY